MNILTDLSDLIGKTIVSAKSIDVDEKIGLVFTDDTYAVFDIDRFGDSYEMVLGKRLGAYNQCELGVISKEEYQRIEQKQIKEQNLRIEANERAELARLKEKYGD